MKNLHIVVVSCVKKRGGPVFLLGALLTALLFQASAHAKNDESSIFEFNIGAEEPSTAACPAIEGSHCDDMISGCTETTGLLSVVTSYIPMSEHTPTVDQPQPTGPISEDRQRWLNAMARYKLKKLEPTLEALNIQYRNAEMALEAAMKIRAESCEQERGTRPSCGSPDSAKTPEAVAAMNACFQNSPCHQAVRYVSDSSAILADLEEKRAAKLRLIPQPQPEIAENDSTW